MITRHILTLPESGRRVHYRRCGRGPALVMVHQSPRSSAELQSLMERWGQHFTCIAPDTPGFGQSDPLPHAGREPDIDDFADAFAAFVEALGLTDTAVYGVHSGAVIAVAALKRHPRLFRCLAANGYAIWTREEMVVFGEAYLPEFHPSPYGEHLTWLWNRILEQTWFFPWFDIRDETRLSVAHADPVKVDAVVRDFLDAGNAYRDGYGAVLRAPRDIPSADTVTPPVFISASSGDPLLPHIDRLGDIPGNWRARKCAEAGEQEQANLAFLREHGDSAPCPALKEDSTEGWLPLSNGLIHWHGKRGADRMILHEPASELAALPDEDLAIDVPGHGLSSPLADFDHGDLAAIIEASAEQLGAERIRYPRPPAGDPAMLYPDLTPDRFGAYLSKAWSAARAEAMFEPWYEANPLNAIAVNTDALEPERIASRTRARLRAGNHARPYHAILQDTGA